VLAEFHELFADLVSVVTFLLKFFIFVLPPVLSRFRGFDLGFILLDVVLIPRSSFLELLDVILLHCSCFLELLEP